MSVFKKNSMRIAIEKSIENIRENGDERIKRGKALLNYRIEISE